MLPLIGLAATYIPELIRLIAGDKGGTVADAVGKTVADVTKASDPVAALKALQADAATEAELRARLAQIAVDAQKAQNDEADKQRQDELATLKQTLGDTQNARGTMLALAQSHSDVAWGAPVVSVVVTAGFFIIVGMLMRYGLPSDSTGNVTQIVNITIGALAAAFTTVVSFWLGSSQGSRSKDAASLQLQTSHDDQLNRAMDTVKEVSNKAIDSANAAGPPDAPPQPVIVATPVRQDLFDRCVAAVLAFEGGFSDRPDDPGGATNFGITQRTLEAFLGHPVTVDDVRNLSSNTAIEIYRANYWNLMRCGDLPAGVDLMLFDYGINSGPATSVKTLQGLVGVTQDGAVGKITLGSVAKAAPMTLVNGMAQARMTYLRGLSDFATFGQGWTKRVDEVTQKAQEMVA